MMDLLLKKISMIGIRKEIRTNPYCLLKQHLDQCIKKVEVLVKKYDLKIKVVERVA